LETSVNQKIRFFLSAFTAAFAAISTAAVAENICHAQPSASRAVMLTDAQLDEITAGAVDMIQVNINNGNAMVDKSANGHVHCVNCIPVAPELDKARLQIINNPSQTVTHCKGVSC